MSFGRSLARWTMAAVVGLVALAVEAQTPEPAADAVRLPSPAPAAPQPTQSALKDGLAVRYYFHRFNHLSEFEEWMRYEDGVEGTPLAHLDYRMGRGNVLTTTSSDMVGAKITGVIELAKAGAYTFLLTSNDGVRLTIGGVMMHEDPEIHPDTTSPPLIIEIAEPGWYPLDILYYEKKGTATLRLEWRPPGEAAFVPVPAAALKHP